MFIISGTCVNIWMTNPPGEGIPDFGRHFYVDDVDNKYVDIADNFYEDGEPN